MTEFNLDDYNQVTFTNQSEDLLKFSELLTRCPTLSNRQNRNALLQSLSDISPYVVEGDTVLHHTIEIVRTCSNSRKLGLLMSRVRYFEGETDAWLEARNYIDQFKKKENQTANSNPVALPTNRSASIRFIFLFVVVIIVFILGSIVTILLIFSSKDTGTPIIAFNNVTNSPTTSSQAPTSTIAATIIIVPTTSQPTNLIVLNTTPIPQPSATATSQPLPTVTNTPVPAATDTPRLPTATPTSEPTPVPTIPPLGAILFQNKASDGLKQGKDGFLRLDGKSWSRDNGILKPDGSSNAAQLLLEKDQLANYRVELSTAGFPVPGYNWETINLYLYMQGISTNSNLEQTKYFIWVTLYKDYSRGFCETQAFFRNGDKVLANSITQENGCNKSQSIGKQKLIVEVKNRTLKVYESSGQKAIIDRDFPSNFTPDSGQIGLTLYSLDNIIITSLGP